VAAAYDLNLQRPFQAAVTSSMTTNATFLPYLHPPQYTLLLSPLHHLSYLEAYAAWAILDLILLLATLAIVVHIGGFGRVKGVALALLAMGSTPVYVALAEGQSDFVILLPLGISCWAWRRDRPVLAGAMAGLAMVKPNLLLVLPLLFVARRSWPALVGFVASIAGLFAVCLVVFGPGALVGYARLVAVWGVQGWSGFRIGDQATLSMRGPLDALLGDIGSLFALGGLAIVFWLVIVRARPDAPLDFGLAVAWSLAVSPYQNLHDLTLLLIPAAVFVESARTRTHLTVFFLAYAGIEATRLLGPWSACTGVLALATLLAWDRMRRPADRALLQSARHTETPIFLSR
jgi:hypothetical protein